MPSHEHKRKGPFAVPRERLSPGARRLHSQPFSLEDGIPVEQAYRELVRREATSPDMQELIEIAGIRIDSPEHRALLSAGVNQQAFRSRRFPRQYLLQAGYIFLNTIGGGEKPLLSGSVPTAKGILHAGDRILLTQAELDTIITYQNRNARIYLPAKTPLDVIRKDMLAVLQSFLAVHAKLAARKNALFLAARKMIAENPQFSEKSRRALDTFDRALARHKPLVRDTTLRYLIGDCTHGIELAHVRGIPCTTLPQRFQVLSGAPSPFLDSGFHFDVNYDMTLNSPEGDAYRLNMVVVHLLSRGVNEMGASLNRSHDQQYITAGQFENMLYGRSAPPVEFTEQDVLLVARRLVSRI